MQLRCLRRIEEEIYFSSGGDDDDDFGRNKCGPGDRLRADAGGACPHLTSSTPWTPPPPPGSFKIDHLLCNSALIKV